MEPSSGPLPCACEPWWSCRIRHCAWIHDSDFSLICNLNSSLYKSQIEYIFCGTSAIEVAYESGEVFANNTGLTLIVAHHGISIHQGNRWRRDKWVYDCKHFRLNDVSICGLNRGIMDYIPSNPDRHYFFPHDILIVRCNVCL